MKRTDLAAFVGVVVLAVLGLALPPYPPPTIEAKVLRVIDGDTIEVRILTVPVGVPVRAQSVEQVRYIGVNAPEQGQPGYELAKLLNRFLVEGRTVYLELDANLRDDNERLLAYVYLDPEGLFMVNLALATSPVFTASLYSDTPRYTECFSGVFRTLATCTCKCIHAAEAGQYVGERLWVIGTVASVDRGTYDRNTWIWINLERPYPNQVFTILIKKGQEFDKVYGANWERTLVGKTVCAFGTISLYQGIPQIVLQAELGSLAAEAAPFLVCPACCRRAG